MMKTTRLALLALGASAALAGCVPAAVVPAGTGSAPVARHQLSRDTGATIVAAQAKLKASPKDWEAMDTLAAAYLQRVREGGDPSYYPKVEALLTSALAHDRQDGQALTLMGSLALARHQFRLALQFGQQARAALPASAGPLGIIVDAQTQLGDYPAAVASCQQMVDLKPDLASYARVSYLRELHGDVAGAIDAMRQAVEAGGPVPENGAYTRTLLGNLYFNSAQLDEAEAQYQQTLAEDPGYPGAIAGMARVRAAQKRYPEAIGLYNRAVQANPLPDSVIALGDVYAVSGDSRKAADAYNLARAEIKLYQANGVDLDSELALFEIDHDQDLAAALGAAETALRDRPNVVTEDVLAWARFRNGDPAAALAASRAALRLGTRDAGFHYHAAVIEQALGMTT
jgi:tetratricopeptide (TPR) repeat protein